MHDDTLPILYPEDNSLRPAKVEPGEESTDPGHAKEQSSKVI